MHTDCCNGNTILRRWQGSFKARSMWELAPLEGPFIEGEWEHWMNSACPDQAWYGYWLDTTTSAKWDDRFYEPKEGEG